MRVSRWNGGLCGGTFKWSVARPVRRCPAIAHRTALLEAGPSDGPGDDIPAWVAGTRVMFARADDPCRGARAALRRAGHARLLRLLHADEAFGSCGSRDRCRHGRSAAGKGQLAPGAEPRRPSPNAQVPCDRSGRRTHGRRPQCHRLTPPYRNKARMQPGRPWVAPALLPGRRVRHEARQALEAPIFD